MNIVTLLQDLAKKDIRLWLEDEQLRFNAPDGAMTADVINTLKNHKPKIIQFLAQSSGTSTPTLDIPYIDRQGPFALSPAQQRLWFIQQLDTQSDAYHIHGALKLSGHVEIDKLEAAITGISQRHEVLRSHFELNNGLPLLTINSQTSTTLEQGSGNNDELETFLNSQLSRPFDLLQGPLFRVGLFELNPSATAKPVPEYILCLCMHHIISDGWSLGVLLKELVSFYAGAEQLLPTLQQQYVDYAAWQNSDDFNQYADNEREYWLTQLKATPVLELPFDSLQAFESTQASDGDSISLVLNSATLEKLQALAKTHESTLFMVLLALYHCLLSRLTGQQDFAIGTPVAGRMHSDLENLIGCFVNTQAIRLETENDTTFSALLQQTKNTVSQALDKQNLAFEDIVQHLNIERNIDITPIFQTLFVLQNTPIESSSIDGLTVEPVKAPAQTAQFPLSLNAQELNGEIILAFNYQPSRFNQASVKRFSEYFERICHSVVDNPEQVLSCINLLSEAEQQQVLNNSANSQQENYNTLLSAPNNHKPSVLELFQQHVTIQPQATAVSFGKQQLSYAELDQQSNQLAHLIQTLELKSEVIAVAMPRCLELSVSLLAILKSGCCYLPLDSELPEERLSFIFSDSQASLLITSSKVTLKHAFSEKILSWHSPEQELENSLSRQINSPISKPSHSSHLFNIIYTSGSTGQPKGVMVTQAGIHNRLNWMQSRYPLNTNDKVLQKTPYSFDVSVWELFWPLISGASLHFAEVDGHKNPQYLLQVIQQENISVLHFVPSMFGEFLKQNTLNNQEVSLSSLRQIFTSGEALQLNHVKMSCEKLPNVALSNLYGPTEAAIDVSYYDCPADFNLETHSSIPIGKAISNTQLYILNDALQLQPTGIAGELYIGGVNVAEGYLNRPELNLSHFIENPFSNNDNYKLYKTGDRVRLLEDGNIEYLGRLDFQVKLRGLRIELGEIEACLMQQENIAEVLVNVSNDVLVAYILTQENTDITNEEFENTLRQALKTALPQYMQPQHYLFLDSWPLTPNGKINRKALPQVNIAEKRQLAFVAPTSEVEIALANIWKTVLKIDEISIHDNFFDLGGHSLTATQAFTLTQELYPVQLPLREIFDTPTVAAIAESIETRLIEEAVFSDEENADEDDMESFIL